MPPLMPPPASQAEKPRGGGRGRRRPGAGGAAELGGPDDERLVEQAALFEIVEQAGDGPVDLGAVGRVVLPEVAVGVPGAGAAVGAVEDLHEADAALDEPAGGEAHLAEGAGGVVVEAVERRRSAGSSAKLRTSGTAVCMRKASS